MWLEGLDTKLHTFDLFRLPYSNASRVWIGSQYPGRVTFHHGRSQDTLPHFSSAVQAGREPKCDVWFVDGWHNQGGPLTDLKHALRTASDGATIIADDCTKRFPAVMSAWRTVLQWGQISGAYNFTIDLPPPGGTKGWCVGRYEPRQEKVKSEIRRLV